MSNKEKIVFASLLIVLLGMIFLSLKKNTSVTYTPSPSATPTPLPITKCVDVHGNELPLGSCDKGA